MYITIFSATLNMQPIYLVFTFLMQPEGTMYFSLTTHSFHNKTFIAFMRLAWRSWMIEIFIRMKYAGKRDFLSNIVWLIFSGEVTNPLVFNWNYEK